MAGIARDTDILLVNRGGVDHQAPASELRRPPVCELEELEDEKMPLDDHDGTVFHIKNITGGNLHVSGGGAQCYKLDGTDLGKLDEIKVGDEVILLQGSAVLDTFYNGRYNGGVDYEFGELCDLSKCTSMTCTFLEIFSFKGKGLAGWDTSNIDNFDTTFFMCSSFEEDLSGWCVSKIKTKPKQFDDATDNWLDEHKPVWGTCPRGEDK